MFDNGHIKVHMPRFCNDNSKNLRGCLSNNIKDKEASGYALMIRDNYSAEIIP